MLQSKVTFEEDTTRAAALQKMILVVLRDGLIDGHAFVGTSRRVYFTCI